MGIPKFFRWISERYPGLMTTAKEDQLPEIDNFYLDMNGIIHNCSHPCDGDVHFRITEEEMFRDIFSYIDTLFKIIKPREYFFLAVDGVAPRAKMNQQRGRRFRSAKEAFDREEAAMKKGDILPTEQRFDSNCITPGTEFMVKLDEALKEFIKFKLSTDPKWQNVRIILSGHEAPGEGEHKVMDFIRFMRSQPGYNSNTRHCLYGLDTDLIMLGLASHEPNFVLLREEVKFGKKDSPKGKSQRVDATKINFNVLYLSLLRDYIEKDFLPLKPKLSFEFNLESIIDDWILICFLVGNDFLPHIPHFHIHKNALPLILDVYKATLLQVDGYMNENGMLNLKRFRVFARLLALQDFENYRTLVRENGGKCDKDDFSKLNEFVRQKMRIHGIRNNSNGNGGGNGIGAGNDRYKQRYQPRPDNPSHHSHFHKPGVWYNIQRANGRSNGMQSQPNQAPRRQVHYSPKPSPNDEEFMSDEKFPGERTRNNRIAPRREREETKQSSKSSKSSEFDDFKAYKSTYYREKFKLDPDKDSILDVVHEYLRALQWNLHYYYHGCSSWGWFYPYHYAPFISDIVNFKKVNVDFEMGQPFKPYEQLLSVLPVASSSLLPKVYRPLVTSDQSPLAQFFPTEIEYDLNGKQNDWEAVVLAPFIEEEALLKATNVYNLFLSPEERAANVHGPHLLFQYLKGQGGAAQSRVKCIKIDPTGFHLPRDKVKYGLLASEKSEPIRPNPSTRLYRSQQRK